MKIETAKAASLLGIHPASLFFFLKELSPSLKFEEVWPEVDEDWMETIKISKGTFTRKITIDDRPLDLTLTKEHAFDLSKNAILVIDKLRRQGKWGHLSMPFDALVKITHLPSKEVMSAIDELRKNGFLDHDGHGRSTISLNSSRNRDIEMIRTGL